MEVFGLIGVVHVVDGLAESAPCTADLFLGFGIVEGLAAPLSHEGTEADMEDESLFDLRKVALLVEVRRISDDPPARFRAVHVVEVVSSAKDALRSNCLNEGRLVVWRRLAVDVLANRPFFGLRKIRHGP